MIGDASIDSWGAEQPFVAANNSRKGQTVMRRAKVVDASPQIHPRLQRFLQTDEHTGASGQRGQTGTEGCVQALNERGVELWSPFALSQQALGCWQRALRYTPHDVAYALALLVLDDLEAQPETGF